MSAQVNKELTLALRSSSVIKDIIKNSTSIGKVKMIFLQFSSQRTTTYNGWIIMYIYVILRVCVEFSSEQP